VVDEEPFGGDEIAYVDNFVVGLVG